MKRWIKIGDREIFDTQTGIRYQKVNHKEVKVDSIHNYSGSASSFIYVNYEAEQFWQQLTGGGKYID